MDQYIQNSIDARRKTIDDYYEIPANMEQEVELLFRDMCELGESCADVAQFETELAQSPINARYMNLFQSLKVKTSVVTGAFKAAAEEAAKDPDSLAKEAINTLKVDVESALNPLRHQLYEKRRSFLRDKVPGYDAIEKAATIGTILKNKAEDDEFQRQFEEEQRQAFENEKLSKDEDD